MMKKWAAVGGCAAAAGVAIWLTFFRPSEEDRIREAIARLGVAVGVKDGDTMLSRLGRLRSESKEVVDDNVSVDVPEYHVRLAGRDRFVEDAAKIPMLYQTAHVEFTGHVIKVDDAKTSAKVDATAIVTGTRQGERKVDKRPVHFLLRKDGQWKITTIDVAAPSED